MNIEYIFKIIPIPIFYVETMEGGFAGKSHGFFIRIKADCKDDIGLLQHELTHCKQHYRTFLLHGCLYLFSQKYRYRAEIEAYRVQLQYSSNKERSAIKFANFIATKYNIDNVNVEETIKQLLA